MQDRFHSLNPGTVSEGTVSEASPGGHQHRFDCIVAGAPVSFQMHILENPSCPAAALGNFNDGDH